MDPVLLQFQIRGFYLLAYSQVTEKRQAVADIIVES